jgi:hypothetical protein
VHSDIGISKKAMNIMNSFIHDTFDRIATEDPSSSASTREELSPPGGPVCRQAHPPRRARQTHQGRHQVHPAVILYNPCKVQFLSYIKLQELFFQEAKSKRLLDQTVCLFLCYFITNPID